MVAVASSTTAGRFLPIDQIDRTPAPALDVGDTRPAQLRLFTGDYLPNPGAYYRTNRRFVQVANNLGTRFAEAVGALRSGDVIIDVGAGEGTAAWDIFKGETPASINYGAQKMTRLRPSGAESPHVVALDFTRPDQSWILQASRDPNMPFEFRSGRIEPMDLSDLHGRGRVVYDCNGYFTYAARADLALADLIRLADEGGTVHFLVPLRRGQGMFRVRNLQLCDLPQGDFDAPAAIEWLKSIKGVRLEALEATDELGAISAMLPIDRELTQRDVAGAGAAMAIAVTLRREGEVEIPGFREVSNGYSAGRPPTRRYELSGETIVVPR
jgi:hypothetical protein